MVKIYTIFALTITQKADISVIRGSAGDNLSIKSSFHTFRVSKVEIKKAGRIVSPGFGFKE